jgi:hypothetical protein
MASLPSAIGISSIAQHLVSAPPGTDAFLTSLGGGSTLGEAAEAGTKASRAFSAAEALATLIGAIIAVSIGR